MRTCFSHDLLRPALALLTALTWTAGLAAGAMPELTPSVSEPVRLVFDTDMGNDIDDAMALALLHALQSRGECEVLAVTLTKNDPLAGPFLDAVNTFYHRGNIPIGVRREGGTNGERRFLKLAEVQDAGQLRYPRDLDNERAPDSQSLLREVLTSQPDGSVTLVQVGFFSNLAGLLESPADRALLRRKVRELCVMAGAFAGIGSNEHFLEYNVTSDIPAARRLAEHWPTPIVWSGFEIGDALRYPAVSIERDFRYVPHHIIAEAYCLYEPPPHERPTWDLTAALYAVRPDRRYFGVSPPGRVTIQADGFTRFQADLQGRDRFLILRPEQAARTREALVQLVTQPPAEGASAVR